MDRTYTKRDMLKGGPGLDGYAYCADVYCPACAHAIIEALPDRALAWIDFCDSDQVPQPIFYGESDCAQHCGECGEYLYGPCKEE